MNYGEIIRTAFWITLRNRFLWFFGFFAGSGASFGFNVPSSPGSPVQRVFGGPGEGGFGDQNPVANFDPGQWIADNLALIFTIAAIAVLIVLVLIALSILSQGALAESVAALDLGESRRFSTAWRAGISNFWRVLGYYVLFILISFGLLLVIGIPIALLVAGVFAATESTGARILTVILVVLVGIVLLIVVFIPLSIIGQFALREIVVHRERVIGSIASSYRLFRRNMGKSVLLWLIQLGLSIGIGIALLILILLVGFILFLPTIILAVAEYTTAAIIAGVVAGLILVALVLVASGAWGTFIHSFWTLAYLRLTTLLGEGRPAVL
jgi:hypothetical protein